MIRCEIFYAILARIPVGAALLQREEDDLRVIYANQGFQQLKPFGEMTGRLYSEIWPELAEPMISKLLEVLETGQQWIVRDSPLDVEVEPGRTERRYFSWDVSVLEPDHERYLLAVASDSTSRVTALCFRAEQEEELRQSRSKLDAAIESIADAVCITDEQGRFIEFNHAFVAFHRFPSKAETLRVLQEYPMLFELRSLDGTVVPFDQWPMPRALRGESAENVESLVLRKDTGESWVGSYSFAPFRSEDGSTAGVVLVARDVTQHKRAEEEREQLLRRLEESLRQLEEKDRRIRQAYSDVIDAVTGGQLIIVGKDELADMLSEMQGEVREIRIPKDISTGRGYLAGMLQDMSDPHDLLLAFSEAATNMLKHADGGTYSLHRDGDSVQIVLQDEGPGIDFRNLPKATLVPGFSTEQTLGMGFTLMIELADRILLSTDTGGTTLVLEKRVMAEIGASR